MGSPIIVPSLGSKIGFSTNIPTAAFDYLQNVATVDPNPIGEGAKVQSTSADDGPGGNGILMVKVRYFDANWALNEEYVTMNGITSVTLTANNIARIEAFESFQVGPNEMSTGIITLTSTDGLKLFAQIDANNVAFYTSVHTVAPGFIGYINDFVMSSGTSPGAEFALFIEKDNTALGGGIVLIPDIGTILAVSTVVGSAFKIPLICDASSSTVGLRIGVIAKALGANQVGSASYHYNELA